MRLLRILYIITALTVASGVHAEIPLLLEATVQMPTSGAWDVQHWRSDSTFGWACMSGDTIRYVEEMGDSIRLFVVPDSIFRPYNWEYPAWHEKLRLLRLERAPTHLFAAIQSRVGHYDDVQYLFFSIFDITANTLVGYSSIEGDHVEYWGMYQEARWCSINTLFPWPTPPEPAQALLAVAVSSFSSQGTHESTSSSDGGVVYTNLVGDTFASATISHGVSISPFAHGNAVHFALAAEWHYRWEDTYGQSTILDSCWVNRFDRPGGGLGTPACSFGCGTVTSQTDADASERIIFTGGGTVQALDAYDHSILWQNSAIQGTLFSAAFRDSSDERLLAYNSGTRRFAVFDASNGVFLDSTIQVIGDMQHVIKHPAKAAELVTRDAQGLVRVYACVNPIPQQVICSYLPDENVLRLNWQPVTGASRYLVYSSRWANTVEDLEAIIDAPNRSVDLVPADARRFYFVTAEYSNGLPGRKR